MVALFRRHTPPKIELMKTISSGGNLEEIERAAHSLKSSAGNLGLRELQDLAQALEGHLAEGRLGESEALVKEVEGACARAFEHLAGIISDD